MSELAETLRIWRSIRTDFETILNNDLGRRVAGNDVALRRYREVYSDFLSAEHRLQGIATICLSDVALAADDTSLFNEIRHELLELEEELEVVTEASRLLTPSGTNLASRLEQVSLDEGLQTAEVLANSLQRSQSGPVAKMGSKEYGAETAVLVSKIDRRVDAILLQAGDLETRSADLISAAEAELISLRRASEFERELPRVKLYLGALFEQGYMQPINTREFEKTTLKGPVSLVALTEAGALARTAEGLERLMRIVKAPNNDRPYKAFPVWLESKHYPPRHEFLLTAQELLIKYGKELVSRQLLLP